MNKKLLGGALFAVILMGASCQQSAEPVKPVETPAVNTNTEAAQPTTPVVETPTVEPVKPETNANESKIETKTFNISMTISKFDPDVLNVNVGDTVVVNAKAVQGTHGFSLPDFGVDLVIPEGTTQTATFVANKAGTFTFRCSVYCGVDHVNMKGTLIVK